MRRAGLAVLLLLTAAAPARAAWGDPVDITPRDGYTIGVSDVAIDRHGDVAAIGETYSRPDGLVVYASRDGGPFEGEEVNDSGTESPPICFDRAGRLLVFSQKVDFDNRVRVYTRPPGGHFANAQVLDTRPGDTDGIATSPRGEVIAYWTGFGAHGQVRAAVRGAAGGSFGPVQDVSAPDADAAVVRLRFDRHGNALLTWIAAHQLEYAVRPPGGSFGTPRVLATAVEGYDLGANDDGSAVAVWRTPGARGPEMRAAFGSFAAGFGGSRRLGGRANRGPDVAVDRSGAAVVAWRTAGSRTFELRAATATPEAHAFGHSRALAKGYPDQPEVTTDGHGGLLVTWIDGSALDAARARAGHGFVTQTVGRSNVRGYDVNTTSNGRTVLAWKAFAKAGTKRVKAAVARSGHSFGKVQTLGRLSRVESFIQDPYVTVGPHGHAFAWWGTDVETHGERIWFSGSYLLP